MDVNAKETRKKPCNSTFVKNMYIAHCRLKGVRTTNKKSILAGEFLKANLTLQLGENR